MSELIRRTDTRGRTIGRFFADEVAQPLHLDFYIGLPRGVGDRMAQLRRPTKVMAMRQAVRTPPRQLLAVVNPFGLSAPSVALVDGVKSVDVNSDELRALEIPAGNGTGTARALAKLYGLAATGGTELGLTSDVLAALKAPAVAPTKGVLDFVGRADTSYSLGFNKSTCAWVFGWSGNAFGTPGAGGSFVFADPDTGVGFAYAMNQMGVHPFSDPRELALRQALFRDVLGARPRSSRCG